MTRLRSAMAEMQHRMDLIVAAGVSAGFDGRDSVLEAYRVFTRSQNWMDRLEAGIRSGRSAEAAVMDVQQETRARFERINDLCLRDWLSDLDLIANDLVRGLLATEDWQDADLGPDAVVVADDLSAGEVLRLGQLATAFVLEKSSDTAPAAIIAASLGIPMVVQVDGSAAARDGDHIFVDGDDGTVVVRRKVRLVHVNGDGSLDGQEVQVRSSHLSDNQHGRQASPLWDHGTFRGWLEEVLGPVPDQSLRAMIGYGLSDREIARYYGLDEATIAVVRRIYEMG